MEVNLNVETSKQQTANSKQAIIHKSLINLMSVEVLGAVVNSLNATIDTVVVGQFLDVDSMAAVGFFNPVLTIISLVWVIIIGLQITCGKYIGDGDKESLEAVLASAVVFLGGLSLVTSFVMYTQSDWLATLLGAQGDAQILLQEYIKGYSFGVIGQVYCSLLMWFLSFNYDLKLSRIIIFLMVVSNFTLNVIFVIVLDMSVFGLGLASAISYLLSAAVMLQSFFNKNKPIQLQFNKFLFGKLFRSARYGIPSLTFNVGLTVKSYLLNIALMTYIGTAAVAVMNVQNAIIGVLGSVPVGCGNAFLALGSLWFGSKDREGLMMLAKMTFKYTLLSSAAIMLLLMVSAPLTADIFFNVEDEAFGIAERMLLMFPSFLVLNALAGLFLKSYQMQKKNEFLVSAMPILENLLIAILAVPMLPLFGVDAVWLSFPATEIICILVIAIAIFSYKKAVTFKFEDWLRLDDFGIEKSRCFERTFATVEDVSMISMETMKFCKQHNFPKNKAYFAGLAIEEIATNIIKYGFQSGKDYSAYVRVTVGDEICVRIYDNASKFNLKERLQQYRDTFPDGASISLRIVETILERIDYQNNAGINTVVLVV